MPERRDCRPSQLGSTTDATIDATPGAALDASPSSGSHPYLLTTHIMSDATDDPLPIIEVDTQAPTSAEWCDWRRLPSTD